MLAAVVAGPERLEVATVPPPEPTDRAVVAMERIGLCGTDASILAGKIPVSYPRVLGHELIGRVVRSGLRGQPAEGTRVLVDPSLACGRCRQCRADLSHLCPHGALLGRDVDGGCTEMVAVDEAQLLVLPDDYPAEAAALLQVLGTCVHAQTHLSGALPGRNAAVIGLGVSGLLLLQLLRAAGLRVMGVTRSQWKRELAERLGAEGVVPPQEAASAIAAFTGGEGVDIVVEAVGTVDTWAQAIELAGAGAEVLLFGTIGGSPNARLPLYQLYYKELTIRNPRAARHRDYERAIALATEGMVKLAPLWTHGYRLEQAAEAFTALRSDPRALKVTLEV